MQLNKISESLCILHKLQDSGIIFIPESISRAINYYNMDTNTITLFDDSKPLFEDYKYDKDMYNIDIYTPKKLEKLSSSMDEKEIKILKSIHVDLYDFITQIYEGLLNTMMTNDVTETLISSTIEHNSRAFFMDSNSQNINGLLQTLHNWGGLNKHIFELKQTLISALFNTRGIIYDLNISTDSYDLRLCRMAIIEFLSSDGILAFKGDDPKNIYKYRDILLDVLDTTSSEYNDHYVHNETIYNDDLKLLETIERQIILNMKYDYENESFYVNIGDIQHGDIQHGISSDFMEIFQRLRQKTNAIDEHVSKPSRIGQYLDIVIENFYSNKPIAKLTFN